MSERLSEEHFWREHWQTVGTQRQPLAGYAGRLWHRIHDQAYATARPGQKCIEIGCADSMHLPVIARQYQLQVSGLDYTENGCRQARERLSQAGVAGEIYHRDLFAANDDLLGQFDYVMSFGLVEHFDDTRAPLRAMRRLLKPGGRILTTTPNVDPRSLHVHLQRRVGPKILAIHKLMSLADLERSHRESGFETLSCRYEGMGLFLAFEETGTASRLLARTCTGIVQAARKGFELLSLTPPAGVLTGSCMVYLGQAANDR